jgi:DNA-binding winged helix-turn-helix (wHTH) protein/tetratricopeptide (TPR) repeat protein
LNHSTASPCFGPYKLDLAAAELRKGDYKIRLQEKPFQILVRLLERPGTVVTREELHELLWPGNHFVEFDHNLNNAINKLREALNDSAEKPHYIETIPRRGYRFIAEITWPDLLENTAEPPGSSVAGEAVRSLLRPGRRWMWITGIAVVVVIVVAVIVFRPPVVTGKRNLDFHARDWVLIVNFENRTGEAVLDGTLESALERELSNSQFVNVAPRERILDALRLMKRPADTPLTAALGTEVCLRDGGIRAVVAGRVEKLGPTYVLSAQLLDPTRGVTVTSLSEETVGAERLAAAVRRLSNRVRETLGEARNQIQKNERRLETVTTPSLHALQLYTQADTAIHMNENNLAAELLQRALAEDSGFASAENLLGWAYANSGKTDEGTRHFQRAFALADSVPDRERFFILGSYYGHSKVPQDLQKSLDAYEALVRMYPDHSWGVGNLIDTYRQLGRELDAAQLSIHQADLRPNDLESNVDAAYFATIAGTQQVQPYLQRARMIIAAGWEQIFAEQVAWVELFPAYEQWLDGNVAQAGDILQRVEKTAQYNGQWAFPRSMGHFELTLGRLAEAEKQIQTITDVENRETMLALIAFLRGDAQALKKHAKQARAESQIPGALLPMLMVRAGLWNIVERRLPETSRPAASKMVAGELALARGETAKAISLLEQGLQANHQFPTAAHFVATESLAQAHTKQGRLDSALRVLEVGSAERNRVYSTGGLLGALWLRIEWQRARLYRKLGRQEEARKVEAGLRKLLALADADHPILVQLQKVSGK